jgi:hypothetical protein
MPRLKPSTTTISLRLPESMLDELKRLANQRDVPYQSLLKVFLAERLASERRVSRGWRRSGRSSRGGTRAGAASGGAELARNCAECLDARR